MQNNIKVFFHLINDQISSLENNNDYQNEITSVAKIIQSTLSEEGRIHITGVGKCSHVAAYGASMISSIGISCYFLDTIEAFHGSLGQIRENDILIAISNSGET